MTRAACLLAACAVLTACAASVPPPPSTSPRPIADGDVRLAPIALATGWRATAQMERRDSIVLTLATGGRQVQRLARTARFSVEVGRAGAIRIRLDSLAFTPPVAGSETDAIGTTWQGTLGRDGVGRLSPSTRSPIVDELTSTLQGIFPVLPRNGVRPGMRWADTASSTQRVQAFDAQDARVGEWRATQRTRRDGLEVQPVEATIRFEQLGEASPGGQRMTMTAQGVRRSMYYLTVTGRLEAVTHRDSVAMLIALPDRKETIPTMQQIRTTFRFLPER